MKKSTLKSSLKLALAAVFMLSIGAVSAQTDPTVSPTVGVDQTDADGPSIKVIDNKGTIKYLQSNNGITTITSTAPGNKTTTTWQLGGVLTEDTYIDATNKMFSLKGLSYTALSPETSATGTAGYSLLVRNENTGATEKLLASDLVQSGQEIFTAADDQAGYVLTSGATLPVFSKVWVYRNGAKLLGTTDYTVGASTVTLTLAGYPVYAGDVIEVQYIK